MEHKNEAPAKQAMSWEALENNVGQFSQSLDRALADLGIAEIAQNMPIDHACIRFSSEQAVANFLEEAKNKGKIISSTEVSGRTITILQLHEPVFIGGKSVSALEIPNPKQGQTYSEGWEHVEFVLPDVTGNTAESLEEAFFKKFPHLTKEELIEKYEYKVTQPQADGDHVPNPTIHLKINGVDIKFHANPIQKVVGFFG